MQLRHLWHSTPFQANTVDARRPDGPCPVRLLLAAVLALSGCVERKITITSKPQGALVHLNDQPVGRTPLNVPFTFYGTYDVRLEKEGYKPRWTEREAEAPWWEYPGPDLLAEAVPGLISNPTWHFNLAQAPPVEQRDPEALLENAKQLRSRVREEEETEGSRDPGIESRRNQADE